MKRLIIFKNEDMGSEMIMPVTPESFLVSHGIHFETVNIHTLGDVAIAGYPTLATIKVDLLFPAQNYIFANFAQLQNPSVYITSFTNYMNNRNRLRYIVSGTNINIPVQLESMDYGERDGTNDVYATLTLQERRDLKAVQVQSKAKSSNSSRPASSASSSTRAYKIQSGDTLWSICKKFYGQPTLYSKLASYNKIKNPNLIYTGSTIKIPPKGSL